MLQSSKIETLECCRKEAIELVNKGYLAKAIVHLEKQLGNQTSEERSAAFDLIKHFAFDGQFQSKQEVIGLINLIK